MARQTIVQFTYQYQTKTISTVKAMVIWYIQYKKAPINFQVTGFHKSQVVSLAFHTTVWFSYSKVFLKVFSTLGGGSDPVKCNR